MVIDSFKPLLAVMCPLLCAVFILLFRQRPNWRESATILAGILQFAIIISMAPAILKGYAIVFHLLMICPGIDFSYRVDAFGLIFAITASFLWILVSIYSIGYMRALHEHDQTRFYCMFALAIFSAVSIAMSGNLITFYLFYEILTLSTYWLVAHHGDEAAFAAGRKYLTYLLTSGWFLFAAVLLTYTLAGTTDFRSSGILTSASASPAILILLFGLFALGSLKAAWMPFHSWLPSAMVAPTPVSALLHAVAVVKAGVFGFVRVVGFVYGTELMVELGLGIVLASVAAFTMIMGSFHAIGEGNLKRRLAYSTISQLSYILFGAALLSPYGLTGAMLHIPFHGFMKITLFLCAGAILVVTGKKDISQMAGIGKTMPITMIAFTIGAIGMCGSPPVSGFISKWFLCLGTLQTGHYALLGVILLSSLLDAVYFFPIIIAAFFKKTREDQGPGMAERGKPIYLCMVIPLSVTAFLSIVFFFSPRAFYILDLAEMAVGSIFGGP